MIVKLRDDYLEGMRQEWGRYKAAFPEQNMFVDMLEHVFDDAAYRYMAAYLSCSCPEDQENIWTAVIDYLNDRIGSLETTIDNLRMALDVTCEGLRS